MIDLCREQNVAEPEWEVENGSVKIVFWRPSILTDDSLNGSQSGNQNVRQNVRQNTSTSSPRGEREGAGALILKLRRLRTKDQTCDGRLCAEDGTRICDTAEATPYMLQPGEYTLNRKSRLIQRGNGVFALRTPTIYVGTYLVPGVVKCSSRAYTRLYQRIKKARQRGRRVVLEIIDKSIILNA